MTDITSPQTKKGAITRGYNKALAGEHPPDHDTYESAAHRFFFDLLSVDGVNFTPEQAEEIRDIFLVHLTNERRLQVQADRTPGGWGTFPSQEAWLHHPSHNERVTLAKIRGSAH